ncbi:MAG TPA: response regulator transcription factor [Chitinophagaceae bacterium]|nr:response regulator transcription factor [Chitinophagaceae bacterium]
MNSIAVCIVEDMDDIRSGLEKIIREAPDLLLLGSFRSSEEAIQEIPRLQPDVVVMDINLPGMNGIECIGKLAGQCRHTQFTMFTIYENNEAVFDALAAGASGYLLKNTPPAKIVEALHELHSGGSPMSAHIARKVVASFKKNTASNAAGVLSPREQEVLEALAKGLLYKEIAAKLGISTGTVRQHIHKIYDKLHVQNRTEALNRVYGKH